MTSDEGDNTTRDLFGEPPRQITAKTRRIVEAASEIMQDRPERADFLHAVLCQVGMPRRATPEGAFERTSGAVSLRLEAGSIFRRGRFVQQPLPYGSRPRLVMVHISSEAVRKQQRQIELGDSIHAFMNRLGIDTGGHEYGRFKGHMEALAACRMVLGMSTGARDITINTQPISRFEAWLHPEGNQRVMWPGMLELSEEFYQTLVTHAVPLDHRALAALKGSALALDIYSWLAHRLCRVRQPNGIKVSWGNLRDQFGQEYANPKDFKKQFRQALRQVHAVYPDARIEEVPGGLTLRPSSPPLPKTQVIGWKG